MAGHFALGDDGDAVDEDVIHADGELVGLGEGGFVGDGAFIDRDFNTTDVCLVMDTARMNPRYSGYYTSGAA